MSFCKHPSVFLWLLVFAVISGIFPISANAGQPVDGSYDPAVGEIINNDAITVYRLSDGKLLVLGYEPFANIDGVSKGIIARLNTDGTIDESFSCLCNGFTNVSSVAEQADGKLIIAGSSGDFPSPRIARINSDGSADGSFVSPYNQQGGSLSYAADVWGVQPDGKILSGLRFGGFRVSGNELRRLNSDGSFDSSFQMISFDGWSAKEFLTGLKILPDGKIFLSGKHSNGYLFRINTDGTKDTSFESPNLVNSIPQLHPLIFDFGIQSDGKIVIIGRFISVNGIERANFARLNPAGNVDPTFSDTFSTSGTELEVLSDDTILLKNNNGESSLHLLNSSGEITKSSIPTRPVLNWIIDDLNQIIFTGKFSEGGLEVRKVGRLNSDGSNDELFHNAVFGKVGEVTLITLQPDGKALIAGYFAFVDGKTRRGIARINVDGTVDETFDPGSGPAGSKVETIAILPDGSYLVGGFFFSFDGVPRNSIAKLDSGGGLDLNFAPAILQPGTNPSILSISALPTGKFLVGGTFGTVDSSARGGLARLNADGTLDSTWDPQLSGATISSIVVRQDGKILIGGTFSGVGGFNRANLARLNSDGSVDTSFDAGAIGTVGKIQEMPDGRLLVRSGASVLRRNPNGTADNTFNLPINIGISDFEIEKDGKIVVVGGFVAINGSPRNRIARFLPNGDLDAAYLATGANSNINQIAVQADGKYVIGGDFSSFENLQRSAMARFTSPAFRLLVDYDFDEDGRADISVFRPSENKWYVLRSSDLQVEERVFAISGDVPVPADYDGDGKTDLGVFRESLGDWWSLSSTTGAQVFAHLGASGDIPLPSDIDGDGRADYVVYRPGGTWYRVTSAGAFSTKLFGSPGDKPLIGDFDGDGRADPAIYRPSTGDWWWQSSIDDIHRATHWGIASDIPAPGDYDNDGITDFAVYRPETGVWYIFNSGDGSFLILPFGIAEDKPVPADYDGDGKTDIAVFRPSTGVWYLLKSTEGFAAFVFGSPTDIPLPNAYIP